MKQLTQYSILTIVIICNLLCSQIAKAQNVTISTDRRAELVSIIGRLAEFEEYSQGRILSYNEDIDTYFKEFKTHPVINLAQEYRKDFGLAYDALMWVALHIDIENDSVKINEIAYNNLPSRWTKERLILFVNELSDFYQKSDFTSFYKSNEELYKKVHGEMINLIIHKTELSWFNKFWGTQSLHSFNVIASLVNGCANYGLKTIDNNQKEDAYPVIGVCETDSNNRPIYNVDYLVPMFVHEINHSYDKGIEEIAQATQAAKEVILPYVENIMKQQAYSGWPIILEESMVRAGVINYMQNNKRYSFDVNKEIREQKSRGFVWIEKLADQLTVYQNNRELYPTILDFTPQIAKVFEDMAQTMSAPDFDFPHVTKTSIENESTVSAETTTEIIFTFSKPMVTKSHGFRPGSLGPDTFPPISETEWINETQLRIIVNLEPEKEYSISHFPPAYLNQEGFPLVSNYNLLFKTE